MSVQVSYSKQFALGIILLIVILVIVEIFSYIILNERDSCIVGLWESGLYFNYSENFVKSLCADYKSIIDFEKPYKHLEPNQKTDIDFTLQGIYHTFKKGHKIQIQVQSTWFPLINLNPQTFVPNIFNAEKSDYKKQTHTVFGDSSIEFTVLEK